MKNNKIGDTLKMYRKQNHMTISDVCSQLKETFGTEVAEKTVYGWESNQAHPTVDTFISMCEIYHIADISEVYTNAPSDDSLILTEEEKEVIINYRKYPGYHAAIHQLLHMNVRKNNPRRSKNSDEI